MDQENAVSFNAPAEFDTPIGYQALKYFLVRQQIFSKRCQNLLATFVLY